MTTVTESSDLLDDPIVQERLRPRNNSVTNALYDRYILHSMVIWVVEFSRKGYKIRKVFA